MKKSEKYQYAMIAVLGSNFGAVTKIEILEQLMADKSLAEYTERKEGENA